jgi:hypothetical protein
MLRADLAWISISDKSLAVPSEFKPRQAEPIGTSNTKNNDLEREINEEES